MSSGGRTKCNDGDKSVKIIGDGAHIVDELFVTFVRSAVIDVDEDAHVDQRIFYPKTFNSFAPTLAPFAKTDTSILKVCPINHLRPYHRDPSLANLKR